MGAEAPQRFRVRRPIIHQAEFAVAAAVGGGIVQALEADEFIGVGMA